MSLITELGSKEKRLRKELCDVVEEIRTEKLRLAEEKYGVQIGSVVKWNDNDFRVTEIDPTWDPPWLKGNPQKKDGTFGKSVRHIYGDWEVIE